MKWLLYCGYQFNGCLPYYSNVLNKSEILTPNLNIHTYIGEVQTWFTYFTASRAPTPRKGAAIKRQRQAEVEQICIESDESSVPSVSNSEKRWELSLLHKLTEVCWFTLRISTIYPFIDIKSLQHGQWCLDRIIHCSAMFTSVILVSLITDIRPTPLICCYILSIYW